MIIENLDWEDCINRYDRPNTVMYIDPPYPGNKCNYAHNMRDWDSHHRLTERLNRTECKWILSSYNMPEIHELYNQHYIIPVQAASGMNVEKNGNTRTINKEVLITNYEALIISPTAQPNPRRVSWQTTLNLE